MPDYQVRLTVHADDEMDASSMLSEVVLPPNVELLSTTLLGDDANITEEITKTTFLYNVLHETESEVDTLSDALTLVAGGDAVASGLLIASAGVPRENLEDELLEMGDEGDFFSGR